MNLTLLYDCHEPNVTSLEQPHQGKWASMFVTEINGAMHNKATYARLTITLHKQILES